MGAAQGEDAGQHPFPSSSGAAWGREAEGESAAWGRRGGGGGTGAHLGGPECSECKGSHRVQ